MLILETILIMAPCGSAAVIRKSGADMIHFSSSGDRCGLHIDAQFTQPIILFSDDIEKVVAKDLSTIPNVSHVFTHVVDTSVLVWIIVDNPSIEARHRVFDRELSLISEFPETEFDFNLIPRMGRDADEIIRGEAHLAYARSSDRAVQD
jgi:hypothetical protein